MTAFPELITIDAEIRGMEAVLKSEELSPRHRRGFQRLLADLLKKREKLVEGAQKRV